MESTVPTHLDPLELRARLDRAHLLLCFTPALCPPERDALDVLEAALPWLDAIQVRIKHPTDPRWASPASEVRSWTLRVLEVASQSPALGPLVFVNDRVDVARALEEDGIAGVHLGTDDCPPALARAVLGPDLLIGLSTHSSADVVAAAEEPLDYLGFGPIHPTRTKGAPRGLGVEAAWIACSSTRLPVFPIGGIDATNAAELSRIGRAAVSSAILGADDPGREARLIRADLLANQEG